ncbi:ATPase component of general energizing module of ECF transporters [Bacillus sp. JCM 19047]|uniref:ATP-binding cassette domain-containing protein n=1 Tax=Shouchella miscanthi TaxID=2598861 RepID=A0ABU6NLP3_9BACI|nr:ATP-binding cassette domain-containing protein [Shouchella miscanthi]MED4128911.1 ATP-binding cassette domain-containing protein [Shouchella miscanthi]GAF22614.1 ATPase component of general energizing module of ECF transporters [Bacillus sp. JCM 19047]
MLQLNNVSYQFKESEPVLLNVSFSITKGEYIAIIGRSGSGKSTLGKLIKGLVKPTSGSITYHREKQNIGFLFQNPDNQMVRTIVEDDLAFGLENAAVNPSLIEERMERYAKKLGIDHLRKRSINELSGGQKQRVALAGLLVLEPELIILDEATSMLDPEGRHEVLEQLASMYQESKTLVTITHELEEMAKCTRIIGLANGEIVFDGSFSQLMRQEGVMQDLGCVKPFRYEVIAMLKEQGIGVDETIITSDEELCEALWTFALKV